MDNLQQIFMTAVAAFVFVVLFAKLASAVNNGDDDDGKRNNNTYDFSKVVGEELKLKTEKSRGKTKKKVRFAVDDDEFVVNKVVAGPLDSKQVVVEKNREESEESVSEGVIDYDQTKEGKLDLGDPRSNEGTVIRDFNVDNGEEYKMHMKLFCDDGIDEDEKEKEGLISDEDDSSSDDWEGVERSELEKVFAMAADYVKLDDHLQSLETDVQMQLYGLHKVAMEGPCQEAQPMALKVAARAKWNVWHKLGNMNPDVAMERYIGLLSEKVPRWSHGIRSFQELDLSSSNTNNSLKEREREVESCSDGGE